MNRGRSRAEAGAEREVGGVVDVTRGKEGAGAEGKGAAGVAAGEVKPGRRKRGRRRSK